MLFLYKCDDYHIKIRGRDIIANGTETNFQSLRAKKLLESMLLTYSAFSKSMIFYTVTSLEPGLAF